MPDVVLTTVTTAGSTIQFSLIPSCSGINSLTAFLFCAIVFLYVSVSPLTKKVFFGILAILAAFSLNIVRITSTVILGHFFGIGSVVKSFHTVGGTILAFVVTLLLLFFGNKILKLSFEHEG
jgi:exosortase/archaeosortase family protein